MKKNIYIPIITGILGVIIGISGYTVYKKNTTPPITNQMVRQNRPGMNNRNMMGGNGFATGEVLSKDQTSLTIKLRDGGSKLLFLNTNTRIEKSTEGTISDVGVGQQITATGTPNTDGSITAQSIQIRSLQKENK
jgi:hypothetical protein